MVMHASDGFWLVIICTDGAVAYRYRTALQAHSQALFTAKALTHGAYTYNERLYIVEW